MLFGESIFLGGNAPKLLAKDVPIYGRICEAPRVLNSGEVEYIADSISFQHSSGVYTMDGRTVFRTRNNYKTLQYNDIFYAPSVRFSPLGFGKYAYLSKGVYFATEVQDIQYVKSLAPDVYSHILSFRSATQSLIGQLYPTNVSSVVLALLTGDKNDIPGETIRAFKETGIAHVLAVSGMHLAIITTLFHFLFKGLRLPYKLRYFLTLFCIVLFAALAGFTYSILRASIMCSAYLTAKYFKKRTDALTVMGFAMLVILFINPLAIFGAGFQLSFAALFGIVTLSKPIETFLKKYLTKPKFLASSISVSTGAFFATSGVMAQTFGTLQPFGIVFNLVALPLTSLCVMGCALSVCLGAVFFPLGKLTAVLGSYLIFALDFITKQVSKLPFGSMDVQGSFITTLLTLAVAFLLSNYCLLKNRIRLPLALALMGGILFSLLLNVWV